MCSKKTMNPFPCTLTIAGTDPSGGAGIQADLKTFQELGTYGMSVVTSVVAQNTTGVKKIEHASIDMLEAQLQAVSEDMPIHAMKSGMLATIEMMETVADWAGRITAPYVIDPVMIAQSGDALIDEEAIEKWKQHLIPLATLITPNIPEAEKLLFAKITDIADMETAARRLVEECGTGAALVKGGHLDGEAVDVLYDGQELHHFRSERIDTKNTHGTGCTYSAAITSYLGQGLSMPEAVGLAKKFVTEAIRYSFGYGSGSGPTNHFAMRGES